MASRGIGALLVQRMFVGLADVYRFDRTLIDPTPELLDVTLAAAAEAIICAAASGSVSASSAMSTVR